MKSTFMKLIVVSSHARIAQTIDEPGLKGLKRSATRKHQLESLEWRTSSDDAPIHRWSVEQIYASSRIVRNDDLERRNKDKKLLGTSASLLVTSALLVVTMLLLETICGDSVSSVANPLVSQWKPRTESLTYKGTHKVDVPIGLAIEKRELVNAYDAIIPCEISA